MKIKLLLEFIIYSFLGWLWETAITSIYLGQLVDRGVLDIPLCPIYGIGAFIVIFINSKIVNTNLLYKFILFTIILTGLEYIAYELIDIILNTELWSYDHWVFNFKGKISLFSSLGFGFASIILIIIRERKSYEM